jgi:hypothetical protein
MSLATLYMGAIVAIRHNPIIKAFYDRLVERGKPKKLAITACVHKMLVILNAMVRDNKPYELLNKIYNLTVALNFLLTSFNSKRSFSLLEKAIEYF